MVDPPLVSGITSRRPTGPIRFILYTDDLVGILPEAAPQQRSTVVACAPSFTRLHQPQAPTSCISEPAPAIYTANPGSTLVGPSGRVTGMEFEPELAARAKANFAGLPKRRNHRRRRRAWFPFDEADVIYVNAGCTRAGRSWLDRPCRWRAA